MDIIGGIAMLALFVMAGYGAADFAVNREFPDLKGKRLVYILYLAVAIYGIYSIERMTERRLKGDVPDDPVELR